MRMDPVSRRLLSGAGQHGPIALMYHSVCEDGSLASWPWSISLDLFRSHLLLIKELGLKTICVRDFSKGNVDSKSVLITFDDGYIDNYAAFSLLKELGMCATWFVVAGAVGGKSEWSYGDNAPLLDMMSAEQLREMHQTGMEIGSHCNWHHHLSRLSNDELVKEILLSRDNLAKIVDAEIVSFAYPYGEYGAREIESLRRANYQFACTTKSGFVGDIDHAPLEIRRMTIYGHDSVSRFARKLALGQNDVGFLALARYFVKRVCGRLGFCR